VELREWPNIAMKAADGLGRVVSWAGLYGSNFEKRFGPNSGPKYEAQLINGSVFFSFISS